MQAAALLGIGILVLLPAAAAAPIQFRDPGEFVAEWVGSDSASWVLLVFKNGTAGDFSISLPDGGRVTNETYHHPLHVQGAYDWIPHKEHTNESRQVESRLTVHGTFPEGRAGSLFIEADRVQLGFRDSQGLLGAKEDAASLGRFMREDDLNRGLYRPVGHELGATVVIQAFPESGRDGIPFMLNAEGRIRAEWYDADVKCPSSGFCPDGGGPETIHGPAIAGYEVVSERLSYQILDAKRGESHARGEADFVRPRRRPPPAMA